MLRIHDALPEQSKIKYIPHLFIFIYLKKPQIREGDPKQPKNRILPTKQIIDTLLKTNVQFFCVYYLDKVVVLISYIVYII